MSKPIASPAQEKELVAAIMDPFIAENPYRFTMFAFPWGKEGTPLAAFKAPKSWQIDDFEAMADHIQQNKRRMAAGQFPKVYKQATVSGRGPGKSAELAILAYWMMSTNLGSSTIISANTEPQLKSKTFAELGKWHTMAINSHWFERDSLTMRPAKWFEEALKRKPMQLDSTYYYAKGQLWSEDDPDAFAGTHNMAGLMVEFDEASGIPAPIWTVTEGFFTEPVLHRYFIAASNGRHNTGRFVQCFHKDRDEWRRNQIDSRNVEGADVAYLNGIVKKYGEDSDEARVEVKGLFPKTGDKNFISRGAADEATARELPDPPDHYAPLILGVDVARYGDDQTILRFRQGRDARSIPAIKLKGKNNVEVADAVAYWIDTTNPDAVNIDSGSGAGVIDILRSRKYQVNEIGFGTKANDDRWFNKGTEMWGDLREWLPTGCLPADTELSDDLSNREYYYPGTGDKINLESKEDMKKRGFASPDNADALALTFAVRVNRKDRATSKNKNRVRVAPGTDYDPLARR